MNQPGIRILPPETAKRIAAGEVIERPASALRELLDNAIDAGATSVSVELEGGGVEYLRVVDNGSGMVREDLQLSVAAHATSKIRELDDLLRLSRGEPAGAERFHWPRRRRLLVDVGWIGTGTRMPT